MPSRSRTLSEFTNTFRCRRTLPVSSQIFRYNVAWLRSSSSSAARTVDADTVSWDLPAQYSRNWPKTWIVMVGAGPTVLRRSISPAVDMMQPRPIRGLSELPENDFDAFPHDRHIPLEGADIASYNREVLI